MVSTIASWLNVICSFLSVFKGVASDSPLFTVCRTEECIKISDSIRAYMDTSVDPCEDFYRFVCGKYLQNSKIKDYKTDVSVSDDVEDEIIEELRQTLSQKLPKHLNIRPFKMAQTFYNQCMDKDGIEKLGLAKAKEWYKTFGGWPVLEGDSWDEENFDWINTTLAMYRQGFAYNNIFDVDVFPHPENTTKQILELGESDLGVDAEYLRKGYEVDIVQSYYKTMVDVAVLYGADRRRAKKELRKSLLFEIELAKIVLPIEKMRNHSKLCNPMDISKLQEEIPFIPWEYYLRQIIPKEIEFPRGPGEVINVYVPEFFKNLGKLLEKTPKRVIANYLLWRCALENLPFLINDMRKLHLQFLKVVSGVESYSERYKECIDRTTEMLDLIVSAMYVRQHVKPVIKTQAMDIVLRIHKEMVKVLKRVKWMDEETRARAIEKAHTMLFHVGFSDELLDNEKISKHYEKVELGSNYFDSVNKIMEVMNSYDFSKLNLPFNKSDWTTRCNTHSVNAFYNPAENSIEIPAGILRSPFFSPERPSYLNYGGIGYVIAHEMIHAFDDEGRQFDKDGNIHDWWDKKTTELYLAKAKNIVEEYSNLTVREINMTMRGINTQGENIADHAGIKVAYGAYIKLALQQKEQQLPQIGNYSAKQMFWISAAHTWCTKYRPEALKLYINTGNHPPAEYRINGPFRYSNHFVKDFACPVGSYMNPPVKCNVW